MRFSDLRIYSRRRQRRKKMRGLRRAIRSACAAPCEFPDYITRENGWFNFAHLHLDWKGYGDYCGNARRMLLAEYARRFSCFAALLGQRGTPFQLWLLIHPYDSGSDCLFYHTPNPHSDFPAVLHGTIACGPEEHLFTRLLPEFTVREGRAENGLSFAYYAEGVGSPLF